jgi:hypothetical protein
MLQRSSSGVSQYLDRAARSRQMAREAKCDNLREFHERMEASWMNLAASTAFVERVDLFLQTFDRGLVPSDTCPTCLRVMTLQTMDAGEMEDVYSFKCRQCGATEVRRVRK